MIDKVVRDEVYKGYRIVVKHLDYSLNEDVVGNVLWDEFGPIMHTTDWFNGYVEIPKNHPLYGRAYQSLDFDVHGGLTFSGNLYGLEGYFIGFDCNHGWDNSLKNDEEYVLIECKSLVHQLISYDEVKEYSEVIRRSWEK